jgi:hypothetical protein
MSATSVLSRLGLRAGCYASGGSEVTVRIDSFTTTLSSEAHDSELNDNGRVCIF